MLTTFLTENPIPIVLNHAKVRFVIGRKHVTALEAFCGCLHQPPPSIEECLVIQERKDVKHIVLFHDVMFYEISHIC